MRNQGSGIRKQVQGSKGRKGTCLFLLSLVLVLILESCAFSPAALSKNASQAGAQQAREYLIPVTRGDIAASTSFVGNLQYNQSSTLTWKTGGVVGSVNVKVGDTVRKGDILAALETGSLSSPVILAEKTMIEQQEKLEDTKYSESARMKAYVNLNAKESALIKAKLRQEALYYPRATRQEMERAWDTLALANLNFNYAKQDYDVLVAKNESWEGYEPPVTIYRIRYTGDQSSRQWMQMIAGGMDLQDLQDTGSRQPNITIETVTYGGDDRSGRQRKFEEYVSTYNDLVNAYENYLWITGQPSATDYAIAEGNVQVAQIEYDKALEEYLSYGDQPREKDVNAAQIALNNAEATYNQRFIIAPFDGTITSVTAVEGYYVTRAGTAVRVDDMTRIFIPISIPELDVSSIVNGTTVSITVDAIPGKTFSGHIHAISDAGDTSGSAASFSAVVEVDDPDEHMLAGMTAEISMQLDPRTDVLLIPTAAITYADGKPTVTITDGEIRQTVEIQIGVVRDNIAEVTSGNLTEGTQLIVSRPDQDTLLRLGLDPAEIMGQTAPIPAQMPLPSSSESIYVRASAVPSEAPEEIPTAKPTDIPAEIPSPTESAALQETAVPVIPAETTLPEDTTERDPIGSRQMPPPGEGGPRPERNSEDGEPTPSGMQRPGRGSGRQIPENRQQDPQETAAPTSRPTATPVPAGIIPDKG